MLSDGKKNCQKKLTDLKADDDLEYWLSRPPKERLEALELLWRLENGNTPRLQRSAKIIKLSQKSQTKELVGEQKT